VVVVVVHHKYCLDQLMMTIVPGPGLAIASDWLDGRDGDVPMGCQWMSPSDAQSVRLCVRIVSIWHLSNTAQSFTWPLLSALSCQSTISV